MGVAQAQVSESVPEFDDSISVVPSISTSVETKPEPTLFPESVIPEPVVVQEPEFNDLVSITLSSSTAVETEQEVTSDSTKNSETGSSSNTAISKNKQNTAI